MRLPVSAVEVTVADASWPSQFQAQASGSRAVEVRARVQGIIEKRLYNEGDFVKAGQQMFQLERDQYEAQVQQAQAQYVNAEREWKRIRPLYEKNAVSQKDRDSALAAYDSAKASLRQAKINLDYCQVVAPVSGYSSKENYTLSLAMQLFSSSEAGTEFTTIMAMAVISMLIPVVLYLIFPRYIMSTFASSGIKG